MTTSNSNYAPLPSSFPEGLFFLLRKSCANKKDARQKARSDVSIRHYTVKEQWSPRFEAEYKDWLVRLLIWGLSVIVPWLL